MIETDELLAFEIAIWVLHGPFEGRLQMYWINILFKVSTYVASWYNVQFNKSAYVDAVIEGRLR